VRAAVYPSENVPQPDAAQWRMLCAVACDAIAAAREHGADTVVFGGYRLAARRVLFEGGTAVELTLSRTPTGSDTRAASVRTEVASSTNQGTASVIAWRSDCGCAVRSSVSTAG